MSTTPAPPRRDIQLLPMWRCLFVAVGLLPWLLVVLPDLGAELFPAFRPFCHQLPERTLWIAGIPMVICSRCAGIYAGVALGAVLSLPRQWYGAGRWLIMAAAAVNLLDAATVALGWLPLSHPVRLAVGLALGWVMAAFFVTALRREGPVGRRSVEQPAGAVACGSHQRHG